MKPATVSASLAVISTASKYLHNDLARAIKALEQKKKHISINVLFDGGRRHFCSSALMHQFKSFFPSFAFSALARS